ncbi:hypothetical protein [Mycobacterium sp. 1245805.9]|uniref:hypothetical protein n=1 Tax=Mycobacterium sp. 1245805.9 TaxID=1856862 RepID=UPI0012E9E53C|nr:hypothetical protein [Mycobacterium sp. 1245805.9]
MADGGIVSIVSVIVSPVAALLGAWVNSVATQRQHRLDQQDKYRDDALQGLARFMSLLLDANPSLVAAGDLREYGSPKDAITGLYERWKAAREPLVLLAFSHPSVEVRKLAFDLQAHLELVLRHTDDWLNCQRSPEEGLSFKSRAQELYDRCARNGAALGRLLESPKGTRRWWRIRRESNAPSNHPARHHNSRAAFSEY